MFLKSFKGASGWGCAGRRAAAALSVALVALLAALPTAAARARAGAAGASRPPPPAVRPLGTPGELLPANKLEELLSNLPLNDLSAVQAAHYLAGVDGLSALAGLEVGLLKLGSVGLEESLREAIEQLGPSAKLGELTHVEDLLPALEAALEGKLGLLFKVVFAALPGDKTGLEGALGSLNLDQLVSSLLGSAKTEEAPLKEALLTKLSTLTGGLFEEVGTGKLEGLVGSSLTGGFAPGSVQEVAEKLKTSSESVSKELSGQATELLPETTMLTAPLSDGKLMGVAPAVKGLLAGVLGGAGENGKGTGEGEGTGKGTGEGKGTGGSGEGKGSGGSGTGGGGGQGGPGGAGSGGITLLLTIPSASTPPGATAATKSKPGKVTVLSHRVRGRVATVVLRTPGAGRVTLTGRGVRSSSAQAAGAQRLTLRVSLSKASAASLRRGARHRLQVKLKVSFKPTNGSSSSATVSATFA
jgi:hypothetical protein